MAAPGQEARARDPRPRKARVPVWRPLVSLGPRHVRVPGALSGPLQGQLRPGGFACSAAGSPTGVPHGARPDLASTRRSARGSPRQAGLT